MACNKTRAAPVDEAVFERCDFEDSHVYEGEYWPRKQVHPLSLAAGAAYPMETISDVVQTMYVTVISGVLSLWFREHCATPTPATGGDQSHMEFVSGQGPAEIVLPPGQHRMVVGADAGAAVVATIVIMDRERHR